MANSVNIYTVDAITAVSKQFALNFTLGYLSQSHIEAFVVDELDGSGDQVFRTVTFINDALVELSGTLVIGDIVHVQRTTPNTSLIHDYQAGAVLKEANLDDSNLQALMLLHEIYDGRQIDEFAQDLNMNLNDIVNIGITNTASLILNGQVILSNTDVTSAQTAPFNTTANMQLANLTAGQTVTTQEFSVGNGGGGAYIVEAGNTSDTFARLLNANATTSVLQEKEPVNINLLGAIYGGSTDAFAVLSYAASNLTTIKITGATRVSTTVDLSAIEVEFCKGGSLIPDTGVTITLGAIKTEYYQIFSGLGDIVFTRATKTCYPEWFGAAQGASLTNDVPAIHKAVAAATANFVEIAFYGEYGLGEQLTLTNLPAYTSSRTAEFQPISSFANGPITSGGNWNGQTILPRISGFTGFGLKVFGSRVADIYCPLIANCGDGLVMEMQIAATGQDKILDSRVTVTQIGNVARAIVIKTDSENTVYQGNEIYVNFVNDFSVAALDWETTGAAVAHDWDSNKVIFQATDPIPNLGVTTIRGPSTAGITVDRWIIAVETWSGGLDATGKFITGNFNDLDLKINPAETPVIDQIQVIGTNNKLDFTDNDGANNTAIVCTDSGNTRASFNSGLPLYKRRVKLSAVLPVAIGAGQSRTFYFYHQCTDRRTQFSVIAGEASAGLNGFVPQTVRDNSAAVDDEVFISFINISGATKNMGEVINFYAEISGL